MARIYDVGQALEIDRLEHQLKGIVEQTQNNISPGYRTACLLAAHPILLDISTHMAELLPFEFYQFSDDIREQLEMLDEVYTVINRSVRQVSTGIHHMQAIAENDPEAESLYDFEDNLSELLEARCTFYMHLSRLEDFSSICEGWRQLSDILQNLLNDVCILRRCCLFVVWQQVLPCPRVGHNLVAQIKLQVDINNEAKFVLEKLRGVADALILGNTAGPNSWVARFSPEEIVNLMEQLLNLVCNAAEDSRAAVLPVLDPDYGRLHDRPRNQYQD